MKGKRGGYVRNAAQGESSHKPSGENRPRITMRMHCIRGGGETGANGSKIKCEEITRQEGERKENLRTLSSSVKTAKNSRVGGQWVKK